MPDDYVVSMFSGEEQDALLSIVNAVSAPSQTVTLEASELAAWLNALPRLVAKDYVIKVKAGTVSQTLNFTGFYGPGKLYLEAIGSAVTLSGGVYAYNTATTVLLVNFTITGTAGQDAALLAVYAKMVRLTNCSLVGNGTRVAVYAQVGSEVFVDGGSITGYYFAADAITLGKIALESVACSGNTTGAMVWGGGIILIAGSTPNTLGGGSNNKGGGMIVAANGTLL